MVVEATAQMPSTSMHAMGTCSLLGCIELAFDSYVRTMDDPMHAR